MGNTSSHGSDESDFEDSETHIGDLPNAKALLAFPGEYQEPVKFTTMGVHDKFIGGLRDVRVYDYTLAERQLKAILKATKVEVEEPSETGQPAPDEVASLPLKAEASDACTAKDATELNLDANSASIAGWAQCKADSVE